MTIEMRHLRAFRAIAAAGSVSGAAERLHISQPALSRTLAQLEADVGVELISRSTHHLRLTDAGHRFDTEAARAIVAFDRAVRSPSSENPPLRVGQSWSVGAAMARAVRAWDNAFPGRPIELRHSEDRLAGLESGSVDVAITRGPVGEGEYRSRVVARESRVVAVPGDHHLADRKTLLLADLTDERLVLNSRSGTTSLDLWSNGTAPQVAADTSTTDDWLVAIAAGRGIGISVASTAEVHARPGLRFIALSDGPTVDLLAIWPASLAHPEVANFIDLWSAS